MINGASVNVLDFGADSTGATDSRAAIQAAIDYAYSLRDPVSLNKQPAVYLPAGKYLIQDSLVAYDYTTIVGEGYRNTYIQGNLANKSIIRSQYGESPSYTDRTIGWSFKDFTVRDVIGAANTIGLNLGNVGYSDISTIGISGFYIGLRATQRVYYTRLDNITITGCVYGMELQSDGGGNNITNCHIGFAAIGIRIFEGAWEMYGGTVDTNDPLASECIYAGVTPTNGTNTTFQIFGTYLESSGSTPACIRFGNTITQSSVFGITRRNVVGPIVYDAGTNTTAIIVVAGTGQFNTQSRNIQQVFSRNYNTVDGAIAGKEGSVLQVLDSSLTGAGSLSVNALMVGGSSFSGPGVYSGAGSPEGVFSAQPGALWLNSSGGAGTTLYVKESGIGNTGWIAK
jgi:hypothetical protein